MHLRSAISNSYTNLSTHASLKGLTGRLEVRLFKYLTSIRMVKRHFVQALDSFLQELERYFLIPVKIYQTAGEDDFSFVVGQVAYGKFELVYCSVFLYGVCFD